MNFQQLSNLQYWTSLFSSPWTIVINLIGYSHCDLYFISFYQSDSRTKIMIWCGGVLAPYFSQTLSNMIGLTTISG